MSEAGDTMKKDHGKPRMDLIPPDVLLDFGTLLGIGVDKHGEETWKNKTVLKDHYAALQRHANKWAAGEDYDDENFHHMLAVMFRAVVIYWMHIHNRGVDYRGA